MLLLQLSSLGFLLAPDGLMLNFGEILTGTLPARIENEPLIVFRLR